MWGRKDGFPGADGSTIIQSGIPNATTISIYGDIGTELEEGSFSGFRRVSISTSGVLNGNNALVYSIKNPLSFIYNSNEIRDWYTDTDSQNDALWGDGINKSMYDPCPQGWKIPQNGTWDDFSMDNCLYFNEGQQTETENRHMTNGRCYKNINWYGASGYRHASSGQLSYIGSNSYAWMLSPGEVNAFFIRNLYYTPSHISPKASSGRANGFPVRCVQE